jgi:hypothetical protein
LRTRPRGASAVFAASAISLSAGPLNGAHTAWIERQAQGADPRRRQLGSESVDRTKTAVENLRPLCIAETATDENVAPVDMRQLHQLLELLQVTAGADHYRGQHPFAILSARLDTAEHSESAVRIREVGSNAALEARRDPSIHSLKRARSLSQCPPSRSADRSGSERLPSSTAPDWRILPVDSLGPCRVRL